MKKKSKIILGVCIVAAALIGMSVWNTWFSPTKIAFINFQTIQQGSISKANDNSSIKLSEVSLDNLDRLTGYETFTEVERIVDTYAIGDFGYGEIFCQ